MNILLIYPKYPDTFWSFKHALKFVSKKAANPPLGLITISSLLPDEWQKKLTDLNVNKLKTQDILWADYVFISAMSIQQKSVDEIVKECKQHDRKVVAGGPLFSADPDSFPGIDHLILNEAEITLPQFIKDINNDVAKRIYQSDEFPSLTGTPLPDYSLLAISKYATLSLQYSRGCPFNCEFCDITALFGHKVRTKATKQVLLELENIYSTGWRGSVFFVDDNFIGNKNILKNDLLPSLIAWMRIKKFPFDFTTEASINLADDQQLLTMMVSAGFKHVFVGIETPDEASLAECSKVQNKNRNMINSIHKIHAAGIEVSAGFIVGFDNDKPTIFQRQIDFIQNSGIISAMVGLLNAPKRTRLYKRLEKEGRISGNFSGNNTDITLNFIPRMNKQELINGYKKIIHGVYNSRSFYQRVLFFLKKFEPAKANKKRLSPLEVIAFLKSIFVIGVFDQSRKYYWKLLFWSIFNKPSVFPLTITYSIYGYHFRKIFRNL